MHGSAAGGWRNVCRLLFFLVAGGWAPSSWSQQTLAQDPAATAPRITAAQAKELILRYLDTSELAQNTPWIRDARDYVATDLYLNDGSSFRTGVVEIRFWTVHTTSKYITLQSQLGRTPESLYLEYDWNGEEFAIVKEELRPLRRFPPLTPEELERPTITKDEVKEMLIRSIESTSTILSYAANSDPTPSLSARIALRETLEKVQASETKFISDLPLIYRCGPWTIHADWGEAYLISSTEMRNWAAGSTTAFRFKLVDGQFEITEAQVIFSWRAHRRPSPGN